MRYGLVLAGLVVLAGCRQQGDVYERSLEETRTVLKATDVPLHYFGPSADTEFSMTQPDPDTIVWKVTASGSDILTYTANIEPEGDHKTRVTLKLEGASNSRKFGDVEARLKEFPQLRDLYTASMHEATDSALEGRPFNTFNFYPQIARASMLAGQMMSKQLNAERSSGN
jgi:hypothetical protein